MPDYSKGKIYGAWFEDKYIYIGSTTNNINQRKIEHKYKINNKKFSKNPFYNFMIDKDFDLVEFKLIEDYPCSNDKELRERETFYILQYKDTVLNKRIEGRTDEEYYQDTKHIILEKRKELITCECGITVRKADLSTHKKRISHLRSLSNN